MKTEDKKQMVPFRIPSEWDNTLDELRSHVFEQMQDLPQARGEVGGGRRSWPYAQWRLVLTAN